MNVRNFLSRLIGVIVFWIFFRECRVNFFFQVQGHEIVLELSIQKPRWNMNWDVSWRRIIIFAPKSKQSKKPRRISGNVYSRNSNLFPPFNQFFCPSETQMFWGNANIFFRFMLWCSQVSQWTCKRYNTRENYRSAHTRYVCVITLCGIEK